MVPYCKEITEFSVQTWWPIELSGGEPLSTGPFLVSISSDGASDSNSATGETDYVVTRLTVTNQVTSESREVTHFQFVSWPDYGVPDSALSMLTFLQRVRETQATATLNLQQGQLKTILPILRKKNLCELFSSKTPNFEAIWGL